MYLFKKIKNITITIITMLKKLAYIVSIITLIYLIYISFNHKQFINKHSYYRINNKGNGSLKLNQSISDVFRNYNVFSAKTKEDATIFFMDKFSDHHIFDIIKKIPNYTTKYIYNIVSIDYISSKSKLYEMMKKNSKYDDLEKIFPSSYILENKSDVDRLHEYMKNKDKPVIFKKNIQQQKGCDIVRDIKDINHEDYVIAQELLRDPYLIDGRKINIRVYLLLSVDRYNKLNVYMYNDGFIYYTSYKYLANNDSRECNITTGYIDRSVYEKNPLTIKDFNELIGHEKARVFNRNVSTCFKTLFTTIKTEILPIEKILPMNKFVIMGADIAVDKDLRVKIMEINKGPDLRYKDKRDGNVKYNLLKNTFAKMRIINTEHENFITIV